MKKYNKFFWLFKNDSNIQDLKTTQTGVKFFELEILNNIDKIIEYCKQNNLRLQKHPFYKTNYFVFI